MSQHDQSTVTGRHGPGKPSDAGGPAEGLRRKGRGLQRVLNNQPAAVLEYQIRLLESIRKNGAATVDDGESRELHSARFRHKGIRGASVSGLVHRRIIVATSRRLKSQRPHRHGGENREWRAADPASLPAIINSLKGQLAGLTATGGKAVAG